MSLFEIPVQGSINQRKLDPKGNRFWKVSTEPAAEPITTAVFKTYARIDGDAEDTLIDNILLGVRRATELYLNRALITQSITLTMDWWPGVVVKLPMPPLISVTSIKTVDEDDTGTTYSSSSYYVRTNPDPGQIVIRNGDTPPTNTDRYYGGYEIIYVAGYGDAGTDVPDPVLVAMKLWATLIYENRIPIAEPPVIAKSMLDYYRMWCI